MRAGQWVGEVQGQEAQVCLSEKGRVVILRTSPIHSHNMKRVTNFLSGDSGPARLGGGSKQQQQQAVSTAGKETQTTATNGDHQQQRGSSADSQGYFPQQSNPRMSLPACSQPQQQQYFLQAPAPITPGGMRPSSPLATPSPSSNSNNNLSRPPSREPITPSNEDAGGPVFSSSYSIDRADLHKLLKSYETILVTLDEYRQASASLSRLEKKLSKACVELSKSKAVAPLPSTALHLSANILESSHEASSKCSKMVQKEYEALNDSCAKYFKKVAKEERAHDDLVESLEAKVRKAQSGYEKVAGGNNNRRNSPGTKALEAHDKYIATISALTNDITRAKTSHAVSTGGKSHATNILLASTLGGIAETSFRSSCENVRRTGPHIGPLMSALNFCSSEVMPTVEPASLSEEELGRAAALAVAEAQSEANRQAREELERQVREEAVAAWKAQQLGWYSPEQFAAHQQQRQETAAHQQAQAQRRSVAASNLPKLDAAGRPFEASSSLSRSSSPDAESTHTAGPSQQQQQHQQQDFRSVPPPPRPPPDEGSASVPTALSRAGTQNSLHSMAVTAQEWERDGSVAESHHARTGRETPTVQSSAPTKGILLNGANHAAQGTIIDRGESDEQEDAAAVSPSQDSATSATGTSSQPAPASSSSAGTPTPSSSTLSSSGSSSRDSAGGVSFPRTPDESEDVPVRGVAIPPVVPEEREESIKADTPEKQPQEAAAVTRHERRLSTWERERERERQLQREAELERRLRETEQRLRFIERVGGGGGGATSPTSPRSVSGPVGPGPMPIYRQELPPQSLPTSRSQDMGVTRTASTDSEKSFVARMKARYQFEKEAEREAQLRVRGGPQQHQQQHEYMSASAGARPALSQRGYTAPQQQQKRHTLGGAGDHQLYNTKTRTDEFGTIRSNAGMTTHYASPVASHPSSGILARGGDAAPHSSVCGCARCSARHYGGGGGGGGVGAGQQQVSDGFGGYRRAVR